MQSPPTSRFVFRQLVGGIIVLILFATLFFILTKNVTTTPPVNNYRTPLATTAISPTASPAAAWTQLMARSLHLPSLAPGASCPAGTAQTVTPEYRPALGAGPVYLVGAGSFTAAADWAYDKTFWVMDSSHHDDILIRGQQLAGLHQVQFSGGIDQPYTQDAPPIPQLRLSFDTVGGAIGSPWHTWIAYTRIQAPGCYAVQVDGDSFSEVIVFNIA